MAEYQCPKCSAARAFSVTNKIDKRFGNIEVTYECGSKLVIHLPDGYVEWIWDCKLAK